VREFYLGGPRGGGLAGDPRGASELGLDDQVVDQVVAEVGERLAGRVGSKCRAFGVHGQPFELGVEEEGAPPRFHPITCSKSQPNVKKFVLASGASLRVQGGGNAPAPAPTALAVAEVRGLSA
jgi:hypothetical protein